MYDGSLNCATHETDVKASETLVLLMSVVAADSDEVLKICPWLTMKEPRMISLRLLNPNNSISTGKPYGEPASARRLKNLIDIVFALGNNAPHFFAWCLHAGAFFRIHDPPAFCRCRPTGSGETSLQGCVFDDRTRWSGFPERLPKTSV